MNDLQLMEAEADVYEALGRTVYHLQQLHEHAHMLNYKSSEEVHLEFRKSFYALLAKIHDSHKSLISLFEMLCDIHGVQYKD